MERSDQVGIGWQSIKVIGSEGQCAGSANIETIIQSLVICDA